jgi:hypothetical protein
MLSDNVIANFRREDPDPRDVVGSDLAAERGSLSAGRYPRTAVRVPAHGRAMFDVSLFY